MPRFVPRERKHKVRRRDAYHNYGNVLGDSNVSEVLPGSQAKKEEDRKLLKETLSAQQSSMSSKKRKRLDKYIVKLIIIPTLTMR